MSKCIILIGPPCSGKSTIGKAVAHNIGYKYISSGDIARKLAEEDNSLDSLNAGNMAPEQRMRGEINKALDGSNIILDGFPRFIEQLDWMLFETRFDYEFIYVIIDAVTVDISNRVINRNRQDDSSFMHRFEYYMKNTVPLINRIKLLGYKHTTIVNDVAHVSIRSLEDYLNGSCGI